MMELNSLDIIVYNGTTELDRFLVGTNTADSISIETQYPFGLYGPCSFRVPRDILSSWGIRGANRISIFNGIVPIYEGRITNLKNAVDSAGASALVECAGMWGDLLNRAYIDGMWVDTRMDQANWHPQLWMNASSKVTWEQQDARLRITPKNVAFLNTEFASLRYDVQAGKTIKRITYDYDLQEGAQQWTIKIWNGALGNIEPGTTIAATGTGSIDVTLGTATTWLELIFESNANQTPAADGTIYGEWSNMCVYYEAGSINLTEIAKDVVGYLVTDGIVNADVSKIGTNSLALVPFSITTGTAARILAEAAKYGDSNYNRWAVGVKHSLYAQTPNGKPVIYAEQYPVLTDYDYVVSMEEAGIQVAQNYDAIVNWVVVEYKDPNGVTKRKDPDSDATLTDAASVALYGKRLPPGGALKVDTNETLALNFARVYLAANKLPQWTASGPIHVKGFIRHKQQFRLPASQIEAGKRLRIENSLQDLSGSGLTFIIQKTRYNDDDETCEITIGVPDDLVTRVNRL